MGAARARILCPEAIVVAPRPGHRSPAPRPRDHDRRPARRPARDDPNDDPGTGVGPQAPRDGPQPRPAPGAHAAPATLVRRAERTRLRPWPLARSAGRG